MERNINREQLFKLDVEIELKRLARESLINQAKSLQEQIESLERKRHALAKEIEEEYKNQVAKAVFYHGACDQQAA